MKAVLHYVGKKARSPFYSLIFLNLKSSKLIFGSIFETVFARKSSKFDDPGSFLQKFYFIKFFNCVLFDFQAPTVSYSVGSSFELKVPDCGVSHILTERKNVHRNRRLPPA